MINGNITEEQGKNQEIGKDKHFGKEKKRKCYLLSSFLKDIIMFVRVS